MNMKTNYLKLNSWAVAALMGMCSLAACSDDNSGEGGGNGDSEEVIANNGTLKGSVDGSKTVILTKGYNFSLDGEYIVKAGSTLKIGEGVTISAKSDDATIDYILVEQGAKIEAVGTASAPIVMTADTKEPGSRRCRLRWFRSGGQLGYPEVHSPGIRRIQVHYGKGV